MPEHDASQPPASTTGSTTMRTRPRPAPPGVDRLPPWRVLLHNDDVNDDLYVVATIRQLMSLPPADAVQRMLEAHKTGISLLMVTHRERAELLQEQFHSKLLTVTIEPAG